MSDEKTPEQTSQLVLPGDQTGIYYITFSNVGSNSSHVIEGETNCQEQLPFDALVRSLKEWIRKEASCEVDYVEVFPKSTSGWVRLKGKDNFKKAWSKRATLEHSWIQILTRQHDRAP